MSALGFLGVDSIIATENHAMDLSVRRIIPYLMAAIAGLVLSAGAAEPPVLPANGGFEDVDAAGAPLDWAIHDRTSTVVAGDAAEGQRAVRIVDPGADVGSDVLSARFAVAGGGFAFLRLKVRLETGDAQGLGLYLRFWDGTGKELAEARESQITRPAMEAGAWVDAAAAYSIPAQAVQAAVWLHTFSVAVVTCRVDAVAVTLAAAPKDAAPGTWSGGDQQPEEGGQGTVVVRWDHARSPALALGYRPPADWSSFGTVRFRLHSAKATGSGVMFIVTSENPASEGTDYYSYGFKVDWTGWRKFELPLRELGVTRQPLGWQSIDGVTFTASGWGNTPNSETVLLLKDFRLTDERRCGPLMDDAAFFAALDLDRDDLAGVREAVAAGNLAAAKTAYARHLRERASPRWRIDWRQHPYRGATVPPPEADKDPESWDYYSRFLTIDWEGWKLFSLKKDDFTGRTFVEGKGWQGKNPIGWNWIKYIALNASGWGLTPDSQTVLCFDDVRLVGPAQSVTIADFEQPDPPFSGLQRDDRQAKSGAWSGRWENLAQATSVNCRNLPHDWTPFERLEFWAYSPKATGARVIMVLDSDPPKLSKRAQDIMAGRFTYTFAGGNEWTTHFDGPIDWHANPTAGPARTHLWNECLHRHFHFGDLSTAYWETGDERPVQRMVEQWLDWIQRNPPPLNRTGNESAMTDCSFQTLTTGIRLEGVWPDAFYRCLGSPAFTDEVVVGIAKSVADQARHLLRRTTGGNWLTEESMGLYTAGMLFPEYREAPEWRRTAIARLSRQLDEDVYPDGMEVELAAGYSNWVVTNFTQLLERADLNQLRDEIPADFLTRLERMYNYHLYAMMPNGAIPGLNDSGNSDVRGFLMTAAKLFPQRQDFLFGAALGGRGTAPKSTSWAFPYTGHYVMRSSWDAKAVYALFDAGPYGYGHQHEDKLHLVLYAFGRQLLLDPGNYSYDQSPWRRYVLSTAGHNSLLVDGQGQNRARKRETYVSPKPWDSPTPRGDDALWATSAVADVATGSYRDSYGPNGAIAVAHTRHVVFVKPDYFLITDSVLPADDREHEYTALFHLDAETADLDAGTQAVRTLWADQANLTVIPWRRDGLAAVVVKGQEDPVQGWANHPWRPVPVAVYTWKARGAAHGAWVLYPTPPGEACPVKAVAAEPSDAGLRLSVSLADGRIDRLTITGPAATASQAVALDRLAPDGSVRARWPEP